MAKNRIYFLIVDIGTGSIRSALVRQDGRISAFSQREHKTQTPKPAWSEQDPDVWWQGTRYTIREVLSKSKVKSGMIKSICVCGQMHGPVPVDANGRVLLDRVQLWCDKRAESICQTFRKQNNEDKILKITANPVTSAWTGFKVAWLKKHQPEVYRKAIVFLVPKDFINFKFTGQFATDYSEASGSFLLDWQTLEYSPDMARRLGIDLNKFAPVYPSHKIIGRITEQAADATGLCKGTPVVAGGGDFLVSLLGSGITRDGIGSDLTGTSNLISVYSEKPLLDRNIMNLHAGGKGWIAFTILDAGGECIRWARRIFGSDKISYDEINKKAAKEGPGSEGLIFLPYLTGERIAERANSRAQFFGISVKHTDSHFYRAIMEGISFASRRNIQIMKGRGVHIKQIIAAGGGAKGDLWLKIKASVYNLPVSISENVESGVKGAAILAASGIKVFCSPEEGVKKLVKIKKTIQPDQDWVRKYRKSANIFDHLYEESHKYFSDLESI